MKAKLFVNALLLAVASGAVLAAQAADKATVNYSPVGGKSYATQLYWGDTHVHTSLSTDAAAFGDRLGLDAAYRFARGEEVTSSTGEKVRLRRKLDFMTAADHSDGMGTFALLAEGDASIMKYELGQRWHHMVKEGKTFETAREIIGAFAQGKLPWTTNDPEMMAPVWRSTVAAAERYNEPGLFTAFVGYEWTSLVRGNNLHRVVIYRDGGDKTQSFLPYTLADSADPEDLWAYLAKYEQDTGGKVMAIPHNGNLSNGMMFADTTLSGESYNSDYLQRRARWEPLYEITQLKGDGEAHPLLSADDEFADYETWDTGNLDLSEKKTDAMLRYEYAREALKRGLSYRDETGINPFGFGVIGSTDSHTSLAAIEEDNFFSKNPGVEPSAERYKHLAKKTPQGTIYSWQYAASGYAAVWAQDNTREAIWDAMQRRETYGTTGPRMMVRLFGGWQFNDADLESAELAEVGYSKGVPMGAVLPAREGSANPSFLIAALRDPIGANLDRVQMIKGWRDAEGALHEKVYNVAWGGDRKLDAKGNLPAVGNTVNLAKASYHNTIGAADLTTVWNDPNFDPAQQAFYYVRVLEIPTPRWTAYDAARYGVEMPADVPMTTTERAYTSPIWYQPR